MKQISEKNSKLELEHCLTCLLENLAENLDYESLFRQNRSQISEKKKIYLDALTGVLVRNYDNLREKVKIETMEVN
jgi:hypothetical protein